ncbi:hypothetical protein MAR_038195, partial [Mya arenaria]
EHKLETDSTDHQLHRPIRKELSRLIWFERRLFRIYENDFNNIITSVDIPSVIAFMKEVESPYEVHPPVPW